ncbi:MAG TPA: hypothetical protein VII76_07045 [Acidimicrobiales bacterium]
MPVRRGVFSGVKPAPFIPEHLGGGNPDNDGLPVVFDTGAEGGIRPGAGSGVGDLLAANNLSDVADFGTSRFNLAIPTLSAVAAVAVANVNIASPGATLDSYTLLTNDEILLTGQSTASQNGVWTWNGSSSALTRPHEFPTGGLVKRGRQVQAGPGAGSSSVYANTIWSLTASTAGITIDTTGQTWVEVPYAPLASPAFTGTPTAPTPTAGDSSTKLATTAFVATSFAPLASPTLTGTPAAPTAAAGTHTTQLATTAFVQAALGATVTGKTSNYAFATGDSGGIFVFNGSSITATLLATAPAVPWYVTIINKNASLLTVNINGCTMNGLTIPASGAVVYVLPGETVTIWSDGSNYLCSAKGLLLVQTFAGLAATTGQSITAWTCPNVMYLAWLIATGAGGTGGGSASSGGGGGGGGAGGDCALGTDVFVIPGHSYSAYVANGPIGGAGLAAAGQASALLDATGAYIGNIIAFGGGPGGAGPAGAGGLVASGGPSTGQVIYKGVPGQAGVTGTSGSSGYGGAAGSDSLLGAGFIGPPGNFTPGGNGGLGHSGTSTAGSTGSAPGGGGSGGFKNGGAENGGNGGAGQLILAYWL